jgi:hypothetical protein
MTITVDLVTEAIRTGTTSPDTASHGGHASLVKGVVMALIHGASSTDHVSAASYGGVAMSRIQRNVDTATEAGAAELWFLGATPFGPAIPQGTQTRSYTPGATTDDILCVTITLLADTPYLQIASKGGIDENATNPSVALITGGWSGMAFAAQYSGLTDLTAPVTAGTNCTNVSTLDLVGNFTGRVIRQTTGGTADFTIAMTSAADDVAYSAMMVVEYRPLPSLVMGPVVPQPRGWPR